MPAGGPGAFARYVAIGDSSTEGLVDPDGRGGYRGWSLRLAERLASGQGHLLYANLAVRGRTTRAILTGQLPAALAMRPDLATVFSGTNDVIAPRFDAAAVARDMETMQRALVDQGATVLTFTLPDLTPLMPLARWAAHRIHALNDGVRAAAARTGTILLDFAVHPVAVDPRLWNEDRIHANADGHARIAAAMAEALGLPGADGAWREPLPEAVPVPLLGRLGMEASWVWHHLVPWLVPGVGGRGRLRARGGEPPRPRLEPVHAS